MKYLLLPFMICLPFTGCLAQEYPTHFYAGMELSGGVGMVAGSSKGHHNYGPLLAWKAGIFTARHFSDWAYYELGIYVSRRGNRLVNHPEILYGEETGISYQMHYLDIPLSLYCRVGRTLSWSSYLFLTGSGSILAGWSWDCYPGPGEPEVFKPDDFACSLAYGLAMERGAWRVKIHANMALTPLSKLAADQYSHTYLPFEILLSGACILK